MNKQFESRFFQPASMEPCRFTSVISRLIWILLVCITGCQTTSTVRLTESSGIVLKTLMVVPVEFPPLDVYPDLLETRQPTYRHFDNMALSIIPVTAVYWNQDGILIAGKVGMSDQVTVANFSESHYQDDNSDRLIPLALRSTQWHLTNELSNIVKLQLCGKTLTCRSSKYQLKLPLDRKDRTTNIVVWHNAISDWYQQSKSPAGYQRSVPDTVDAVLEIGIGKYKVFESQVSLQILIKLVDPKTGKVLAKTSEQTMSFFASAHWQLEHDGAQFKSMILKMAEGLIKEAFIDIGITKLPLPDMPIAS